MKDIFSPTQRLANFFDTLSESTLAHLDTLYHPDIQFQDPINQANGIEQLNSVFKDLFHQLKEIEIRVGDRQGDAHSGFLRWTMKYRFRRHHRTIEGTTHASFNADGLVKTQTDFWDASFPIYGEFPLVDLAMKGIKKVVTVRHLRTRTD